MVVPHQKAEYCKFGPQLLKLVLEVLETLEWVSERSKPLMSGCRRFYCVRLPSSFSPSSSTVRTASAMRSCNHGVFLPRARAKAE